MSIKKNRSTDIITLKNKAQHVYAYSLIVLMLFLIALCLGTTIIKDPYIAIELIRSTITPCIGSILLAIPFYSMQNSIPKLTFKEREITNVALNAFCLLLSALFIFSAYNIVHLIMLF